MSFFLVLSQVGFLKHGYLPTLHEFFDVHTIKTKTIQVEYAGSGQYLNTFDVTPESQLYDVIPSHHLAFHGHNGPQIYDLSNLEDQDTVTIRKEVFRGELSHTLKEHTTYMQSIAWNSQGSKMLLASGSHDGMVKIWDTTRWILIQILEGHTKVVNSVAWNPKGTQLASGSGDHTVKI